MWLWLWLVTKLNHNLGNNETLISLNYLFWTWIGGLVIITSFLASASVTIGWTYIQEWVIYWNNFPSIPRAIIFTLKLFIGFDGYRSQLVHKMVIWEAIKLHSHNEASSISSALITLLSWIKYSMNFGYDGNKISINWVIGFSLSFSCSWKYSEKIFYDARRKMEK